VFGIEKMTENSSIDTDFDWLANVYTSHSAINHPSELHGLLIGALSGGVRATSEEWLMQVVDHMGVETLDNTKQTRVREDLIAFYQGVDQSIAQDSSALVLLLPDDDYPLTERVEALSIWVRGFLEGLALSTQGALAQVDEDLQEILKDLIAISQIDTRVDANEAGEKELFEVSEYVRVGVLNLYAEFNQPEIGDDSDAANNSPTLH